MNNADRLKIGSDVFSIRWDGTCSACVRMSKATFVGKAITRKDPPKIKNAMAVLVRTTTNPLKKPLHQGGTSDPKRIADRINLMNDGERWDDFAFLWHPTPYLAAYWFLNESFITPKPEEADVMRTITVATACVELLRAAGFLGTGETTAYPEPEPDPDDDENGEEDEDDAEPNRRPGPWA